MKKNVAGQYLSVGLVLAADGSAATGLTPTVRRNLDGTDAAITGTVTEPNSDGKYLIALSQADTNGDCCSYYITAATAVPVCINVHTDYPQTGDSYAVVANATYGLDKIKTDTAAILADTGTDGVLLAAAYDAAKTAAQAGDAMTLADDAITSAKFDETTAFPVKSADTGSTQIARIGADSDTLETLSDQIDAVKLKTDLITANSITVASPVNSEGDIEIDRGYDYYAADGRELTWTDDDSITWPDLSGATATFIVGDYLEEECTITDPTGPATITLELSAADTELLPLGPRPFRIEVLLDNDHLILQIRGIITVHD